MSEQTCHNNFIGMHVEGGLYGHTLKRMNLSTWTRHRVQGTNIIPTPDAYFLTTQFEDDRIYHGKSSIDTKDIEESKDRIYDLKD